MTSLDLDTGEVLGKLRVKGKPERMLRTPEGARLILLDRGPGKDKGRQGYQAKAQSSATIIDTTSLTTTARVELGWGLHGQWTPLGLLGADGKRLTVICPGYESKKPHERRPRELVMEALK